MKGRETKKANFFMTVRIKIKINFNPTSLFTSEKFVKVEEKISILFNSEDGR